MSVNHPVISLESNFASQSQYDLIISLPVSPSAGHFIAVQIVALTVARANRKVHNTKNKIIEGSSENVDIAFFQKQKCCNFKDCSWF